MVEAEGITDQQVMCKEAIHLLNLCCMVAGVALDASWQDRSASIASA
jgi:hypothetical protein